jgi:tetratricopeptide (TPR) repeat protein
MGMSFSERLELLKQRLTKSSIADQLVGCLELEYLAAEAMQSNEPTVAGEALFFTGFLRGELADRSGAIKAYEQALDVGFKRAGLYYNLGNCHRELQQPKQALDYYLKSLELEPGRGDVLANMAFVYEDLGELANAEECFRLGSQLLSDHPDAVCNLSYSLLRRAAYQEGWSLYELRRKTVPHAMLAPTWQPGDAIQGKKVLTVVEQGYGDVLMFAGLLYELAHDAKEVALVCDERLEKLLQRSLPMVSINSNFIPSTLDHWDARMSLGSLGFLYRNCQPKDFKPIEPYLVPDPTAVQHCQQQLAALGKTYKVGIAWQGGDNARNQKRRTIPLKQLQLLFDIANVTWINLQHHYDPKEVEEFEQETGHQLHTPIDATNDLDALAAMVACLDHVVTVQQTLVHFAGALNVKAEVLTPLVPEWRYGTTGNRMPWWQSVRLHRQQDLTSWEAPIQAAKQAVAMAILNKDGQR